MLKEPKRIIAEEPQSPDRWLKEPRNNHPPSGTPSCQIILEGCPP